VGNEVVYDETEFPCEPWEEDLERMLEEFYMGKNVGTGQKWHTPQIFIDAARELMGEIDLDPATDEIAQRRIKAKVYHTKEPDKDAFKFEWYGKMILCPPYKIGLIDKFMEKTIDQWDKGNITEAIIMPHTSTTQEEWFQLMFKRCNAFCLLRERVKWVKGHKADELFYKKLGMPWDHEYSDHGSCIFYLGPQVDKFARIYSQFGEVMVHYEK
jgi:hypothetical protein